MRFYLTILYVTVIVLTCFSKERAPKPENRFSFSAGIGPSYSIWNDKLLVDGADTIFKGSYYFKKKKQVELIYLENFPVCFVVIFILQLV